MPVVTGKSVGSQNVAKAGSNSSFTSASLGNNVTVTIPPLACPGLPKLTWIVTQTGGANVQGATFQPQVAIRRDTFTQNTKTANMTFVNLGSPSLLVPGQSTVFEFNLPVQEIRAEFVTAAAGANATYTVLMFASG